MRVELLCLAGRDLVAGCHDFGDDDAPDIRPPFQRECLDEKSAR